MTAKSHQIDLPEIPSLPPIRMPEASHFDDTSAPSLYSHLVLVPTSRNATPSAPDTFQTAPGSLSVDSNVNPTTSTSGSFLTLTPPPLSPPSALKKSISVDSFVRCKQPSSPVPASGPASAVNPHFLPPQEATPRPSNPTIPSEVPLNASRASLRDPDRRALPPQAPHGTSTKADEREGSSFFDESDVEQSDTMVFRQRKGKGAMRRPILAPGELGLPSRLQSMNSFPSIGAGKPPAPIVPARSSSLNHKMLKQNSLMSLNTQIPPDIDSQELSPVTIAVVGAAGCGKSTVVRKGLKAYGLDEPETVSLSDTPEFGVDAFIYTSRSGTISVSLDTPERGLKVLEVDTASLSLHGKGNVWPDKRPPLDGLIVCYDASCEDSFLPVENVLREFSPLKLPTVVLACKSDLDKAVDPQHASAVIQVYDVGLVEVTNAHSDGKGKMRDAVDWIFKAIFYSSLEDRGGARTERDGYRNPASPAVLATTSPWDISRASSATPTASGGSMQLAQSHSLSLSQPHVLPPSSASSHAPIQTPTPARSFHVPSPTSSGPRTPSTPTSPTRARSTSDLFSEHEKSKREQRDQQSGVRSAMINGPVVRTKGSLNVLSSPNSSDPQGGFEDVSDPMREVSIRESRAPPWMTLEELLNKLLFMAVSDDDPVFINHFLLTYRRFASPRNILLAMQKRMRSLDQPSGDPMFACYAQMRICLLLDNWIKMYPNDFVVPGAHSALKALVNSISAKTYLLQYSSDFKPFIETALTLKDGDKSWAFKVEDESDVSSLLSEDDAFSALDTDSHFSSSLSQFPTNGDGLLAVAVPPASHGPGFGPSRERKASLPLTAKALIGSSMTSPVGVGHVESGTYIAAKQQLKQLNAMAQDLNNIDPQEIAQEITRVESQFFLQIEPRHWLQHVLVQGRKDPESDSIAKYNHVSNHIATWVVSFILSHDKPKHRARQIEKFVEIANRLRSMHNYSALRAIIAGINSATYEGDPSLEIFRTRTSELWKSFQSFDQLLQSVRSHQKYRMALRNTGGPCIPALEIHLSDLIRADEGNSDYHDDDPNKIHWAKFNMMARFIDAITQCQRGCRESGEYNFQARENICKLLLFLNEELLMDTEMQRSRIAPPDSDGEDGPRSAMPRTYSRDIQHHSKEPPILRKIFFW